jgi:hypothetical protein
LKPTYWKSVDMDDLIARANRKVGLASEDGGIISGNSLAELIAGISAHTVCPMEIPEADGLRAEVYRLMGEPYQKFWEFAQQVVLHHASMTVSSGNWLFFISGSISVSSMYSSLFSKNGLPGRFQTLPTKELLEVLRAVKYGKQSTATIHCKMLRTYAEEVRLAESRRIVQRMLSESTPTAAPAKATDYGPLDLVL